MRPEIEQELSHTLLVELLAYQFASPVRWIETQDVLLAEKEAERVVEVGPAATLGVMASRTLQNKYQAYDAAKSMQRQILCYNKDAKQIYYEADPIEEEPEPTEKAPAASGPAATASAPVAAAPAVAAPSAGPAAQVPEAPVPAVDIVRALIAQKLKKPFLEIPLSKAVKDLVGGKISSPINPGTRLTGDFSRQVNPTERDPWRPRQGIRLNTRKA
jgi:fatty acid synthase subunit alpha